ncbi:MAG: PIN domain-containing protein [Acidobacteria bacterium]|nr:PIN domain-containing protein [Acidobacteriota bacterium]
MYCLDTDILSALCRPNPPAPLIRRLGAVPPDEQCTTAINAAEMIYGAARRGGSLLGKRVRRALRSAGAIMPFDAAAADVYGVLRARLESEGRRLDEPDLRIASIALARDFVVVTGNVKHFARVSELRVENWLGRRP